MNTSTWIFGLRTLPTDEGETPSHLATLFTSETLAAQAVFEQPPTDAELRALYEEALAGDEELGPRVPPQRVLVESGPIAKRVRPLFKHGARVEIDPAITAVIDAMVEDVLTQAIDSEVFATLPDAWKPELIALGAALDEASPWVSLSKGLLRVSAPALGLEDARLQLMGHQSFGFIVFSSQADLETFRASAIALAEEGTMGSFPRALSLELVEVLHDDQEVLVANVDARSERGSEDATEDDVRVAASLGRLLLAYAERGAGSESPTELEVVVRGETVRGVFSLAPHIG